jgi:D-alanine transaminase
MGEDELYLNGTFLPLSEGRIHVEDRGFELGDGVYEVIKILNGRLIWLEDHLARLERSLAAIKMSEAISGHPLSDILPDLVVRSRLDHGMVYVQVTRGLAEREFEFPAVLRPTVLAYTREVRAVDDAHVMAGAVLHPVEDIRWAHCDIKSTNLLAAVLAKEEARSAGANEALFLAPDGVVREGGSSNILAYIGGVLRTHPLDNRILGGVTRLHVLRMAHEAGYRVEERAFTLDELNKGADDGCEVFLASTLKDLMPVVRIGDMVIGDGRPGPVTLALLDDLRAEQARLAGLEPLAPLAPMVR